MKSNPVAVTKKFFGIGTLKWGIKKDVPAKPWLKKQVFEITERCLSV